MELCESRQIPVLFITVPMYYKHIHNYDSWEIRLKEELQKYPNHKWLNLQAPYDTVIYTPDKFEDTYTENQHLSNSGMIVTAYKLSEFIENNYPNLLPDRSKETAWINDFKTTDYFAYNQNITSAPRSREGRSSTSGRGAYLCPVRDYGRRCAFRLCPTARRSRAWSRLSRRCGPAAWSGEGGKTSRTTGLIIKG